MWRKSIISNLQSRASEKLFTLRAKVSLSHVMWNKRKHNKKLPMYCIYPLKDTLGIISL